MSAHTFVACLQCDLLHRTRPLSPGAEARCTRCGARLYGSARPDANEHTLALALAACVLFLIANVFPILSLDARGVDNSTTLLNAVKSLWDEEARAVAALVFLTSVLVPAVELVALTWVLVALRRGAAGRIAVPMLHLIERVKPWGMVEVFMLGVLVSLVKLSHVATVEPGVALFAYGGLMALIAACAATFDADAAWAKLETVK